MILTFKTTFIVCYKEWLDSKKSNKEETVPVSIDCDKELPKELEDYKRDSVDEFQQKPISVDKFVPFKKQQLKQKQKT